MNDHPDRPDPLCSPAINAPANGFFKMLRLFFKAYFFFAGACLAATACFFFASAALDLACFWDAFFCVAFGDRSPMGICLSSGSVARRPSYADFRFG